MSLARAFCDEWPHEHKGPFSGRKVLAVVAAHDIDRPLIRVAIYAIYARAVHDSAPGYLISGAILVFPRDSIAQPKPEWRCVIITQSGNPCFQVEPLPSSYRVAFTLTGASPNWVNDS